MPRPRRLACAVALALAATAPLAQSAPQSSAHAGLFDHVVVFGDSLSDDGNLSLALGLPQLARFTTNPGQVTVENVADYFGAGITPSLLAGTDFAFGGAGVVNNAPGTPPTVPTLPTQLSLYLQATGGKADPNTLYSIWGGANDVFYNVALAQAGMLTADQVQANLQTAAGAELGMIQQLAQAGARYVIVFNLPDIGLTPSSLEQGPQAAAQGTGLSLIYNNTLNAGLSQLGINIVPIDTFTLLREIVADPSLYGFTNVTDPACGIGSSSLECGPQGSGAPYTYASGTDQTYLFADDVHPTTAAHAILAQYVESVITAPGEVSLLAEAPLQTTDTVNRTLRNQAIGSLAGAPGGGARLFVDFEHGRQRFDATVDTPKSSNDLDTLTIGADVHPADHMSAGMALTPGQHNDDFAGDAGGFKLQELLASGYVMWGWQQAYFGAIGSFGHLGYSDVYRNIPLGPATRHETGDTSGSHAAFTLTGGWWVDFDGWRTGPYADLGWQHIHVDGYSEKGNDAATMTFGRQDRHALIATLGWQLTGDWQAGNTLLHPFARIGWNHDSDADPRDVTGGLVTMPGTFAMPGFTPDRNWGSAGIGLTADFNRRFSGWIGYDGRFADNNQRVDSVNVGGRLAF
jgi:outer membrane lipase/esterase